MLSPVVPLVGSALAILTAVLSYGMSRKAHVQSVTTADRQNSRGRSEETMRLLRWAVELATEPSWRRSSAGVATLGALADARMVVPADRAFVDAVAAAVMADAHNRLDYIAVDQFRTNVTSEGDEGA